MPSCPPADDALQQAAARRRRPASLTDASTSPLDKPIAIDE